MQVAYQPTWHPSCSSKSHVKKLARILQDTTHALSAVNFPLLISKIPVQISLYILKIFRLKIKNPEINRGFL